MAEKLSFPWPRARTGTPMDTPPAARHLVPPTAPRLALGVLAVAAILGLLSLGKPILVPVTLAVVLSFAIGPFVRGLRRIGLGHVSSVLGAVTAIGVVVLILAGVIGVQAISLASNFPAYESTFRRNAEALRSATLARLEPTLVAAAHMLDPLGGDGQPDAAPDPRASAPAPIPVEIRQPKATATQLIERGLALAWGPIGTAGIVLLVLVFVLLEQEALRDRFIRLVGGADLRATTTAINDAGDRLSRYLMRQFAVNSSVGLVIWLAMSAIGLPHAALVGALTAVLRFVPFLGVPIAAVLAAVLALAAAPGWTPLLWTLATFAGVQLTTSQVIEPRLYGHATGLSPLSVVLATLFWGWLWGPMGVIIATPLTLCLAVAGRHAESLGFLDVVLGDGPALTLPQKFYQRALSGDASEIVQDARAFLKRRPLAAYCDMVLMPALQLGRADLLAGEITPNQQSELRTAVVHVVESLAGVRRRQFFVRQATSVLDDFSPGRVLRSKRVMRQREAALKASAQGVEQAPAGPLLLCISMGSLGDDLATELLVRILRELRLDARHLTIEDLEGPRPPEVSLDRIAAFCIVSAQPGPEREQGATIARTLRQKMPSAFLFALVLPSVLADPDRSNLGALVDRQASSFGDAALELSERVSEGVGPALERPFAAPQPAADSAVASH